MQVGRSDTAPGSFMLAALSRSAEREAKAAAMPTTRDGSPDFDALRAGGAKVDGILPGGNAAITVVDGVHRQYTIFAAQITPSDGSPPVFTKGVATGGRVVTERDPKDTAVANALQYVHDLPNSLAEVQLRAWQSREDDARGHGGIDVVA